MCGRFTLTITKKDLIEILEKDFSINNNIDYEQKYNIAPSEDILSVLYDGTKYRAGYIKWGFTPFSNSSKRIINVRSETMLEKKLFKNLISTNKILIPADGFYEWDQKTKVPYRFVLKENKLFYFAGLWSKFKSENNEITYSGAIITKEANEFISKTHDRMPIILANESKDRWLKEKDPKVLMEIINNSDVEMTKYKVSTLVNSPFNKDSNLINPI